MGATLFFVFAAVYISAAHGVVIKSPLIRVPSLEETLIRDGLLEQYLGERDYMLANGQVPAKDYFDIVYVSEISLGTPAQKFQILLDTGSSNLWVPDLTCGAKCSCLANICQPTSHICSQFCPDFCCKANRWITPKPKTLYVSANSSSYVADGRPWHIRYGTGSARGILGIDKLCMGSLCINNQTFGQASKVAPFFSRQPMDGILGLGWPAISVDHVTPPFFNLLPQLDKSIFTVWMTALGQQMGGVGGQFTFGAMDPEHCSSEVNYQALSAQTYWQFQIGGVKTGNFHNSKQVNAISDTGTTVLFGPPADIDAIHRVLKRNNSEHPFRCGDNLMPIVFTINGKDHAVSSSNYIIPVDLCRNVELTGLRAALQRGDGEHCQLALAKLPAIGFSFKWLLGMVFIREYCVVYDVGNKRIGFAKAMH